MSCACACACANAHLPGLLWNLEALHGGLPARAPRQRSPPGSLPRRRPPAVPPPVERAGVVARPLASAGMMAAWPWLAAALSTPEEPRSRRRRAGSRSHHARPQAAISACSQHSGGAAEPHLSPLDALRAPPRPATSRPFFACSRLVRVYITYVLYMLVIQVPCRKVLWGLLLARKAQGQPGQPPRRRHQQPRR